MENDNIIDLGEFVKKEKKVPKIWLCGLCQPEQYDNIKETVEPIAHLFAGLNYTYSGAKDKGFDLLESLKGAGQIIYLPKFPGAFDHARNCYLFAGNIEFNDWIVNLDLLEKMSVEFVQHDLPILIKQFDENFIDAVYLHSKILMFKFTDEVCFRGGVHETISEARRSVELTRFPAYSDSSTYFTNLRPLRRDKYHWLGHFVKYYFLRDGSRCCLDGLSHNFTDPKEIQAKWVERETRRREFKDYLRNTLKINLDFFAFSDYLIANKDSLPAKMKDFINNEKILNDVYRRVVLGQEFEHSHKLSEMIKI